MTFYDTNRMEQAADPLDLMTEDEANKIEYIEGGTEIDYQLPSLKGIEEAKSGQAEEVD